MVSGLLVYGVLCRVCLLAHGARRCVSGYVLRQMAHCRVLVHWAQCHVFVSTWGPHSCGCFVSTLGPVLCVLVHGAHYMLL